MGHNKPGHDDPDASNSESIPRVGAAAGSETPDSGLVSIRIHKDTGSASDGVSQAARRAGDLASNVAGSAREVAVDLTNRGVGAASAATSQASDFVSHAATRATQTAGDIASNVVGGVRGVAGDLAERGADAASAASARAQSLAAQLEAAARRNPIGAILGAFAIGALIGMRRRR